MANNTKTNEMTTKTFNDREFRFYGYRKVDVRIRREYGARLKMTTPSTAWPFLVFDDDDRTKRRYPVIDLISEAIEDAVIAGGFTGEVSFGSESFHAWRDGDDVNKTIQILFSWEAEKPSVIKSREDCLAEAELIAAAVAAVLDEAERLTRENEELKAREKREREIDETATFYARHIMGEIKAKAKTACRYKQRLAALEAELKAEIDAQLEAYKVEHSIESIVKEHEDANQDLDVDALTLAWKDLKAQADKGRRPGLFLG